MLLRIGDAGSITGGIACHFQLPAFFLWAGMSAGLYRIAAAEAVMLLVCQLPFAIGLYGLHRNLGSRGALIGATMLVSSSISFVLLILAGIGSSTGPSGQPLGTQLMITGAYVSAAVGFIVAGIAVRHGSEYLVNDRPALDAGTVLAVGGGMLALFSLFSLGTGLCTPPGWIVAAAGQFMSRKLFQQAPVPGQRR